MEMWHNVVVDCSDLFIYLKGKRMESIQQIVSDLQEKTAVPSLVLKTQQGRSTSIVGSKFGGEPYLPPDFDYPLSSEGQPLKLLAQLNFAELLLFDGDSEDELIGELENFPTSGILQFYILPSDVFGVNFDDPTKQDEFRIVYHADVQPENHQAQMLPEIVLDDDENIFPFDDEFILEAVLEDSSMRPEDFRLEEMSPELGELYAQAADKVNAAISDQDYVDAMLELSKIDEVLFGELGDRGGHRVGGYPAFTQHDPRGNPDKDFEVLDTLLLQIDSEFDEEGAGIMWGDMGVANFFIAAEDLRNLDFSRVLYTWDCY